MDVMCGKEKEVKNAKGRLVHLVFLRGVGLGGEAGSVFSLCFLRLQIMLGSQQSDKIRIARVASVALFCFALVSLHFKQEKM